MMAQGSVARMPGGKLHYRLELWRVPECSAGILSTWPVPSLENLGPWRQCRQLQNCHGTGPPTFPDPSDPGTRVSGLSLPGRALGDDLLVLLHEGGQSWFPRHPALGQLSTAGHSCHELY
uniref:Uncharacterized protein n=1 Tax=Timema douglasi TaxID=61478 RepID=A0A7R8VZB4_TIMDO|nr:unnamed protein product [Timema douglasi]